MELYSSQSAQGSATPQVEDANIPHSSNIYADVATRWDCQNYYGLDKWFGGHRNGATGLANPYTTDINSEFSLIHSHLALNKPWHFLMTNRTCLYGMLT